MGMGPREDETGVVGMIGEAVEATGVVAPVAEGTVVGTVRVEEGGFVVVLVVHAVVALPL